MSPNELREVNRTVPFEPFRIVLSDGNHFDVKHPEFLFVGARTSYIGLPDNEQPEFFGRTIRIDNLHITSVIPLSHINA